MALIITIIVLLILAGISLSFVFNGGILDKSQQAVNEYQKAASEEENELDKIDKKEIGGGSGEDPTNPETPSVDGDGLATEDTTIVANDDPNVQIVIPEGFAPVILETGRTDSMPGENGTVKEIMPVEQWNNITAEQINKGIVVVDNAITYTGSVPDFNEYVWIPISDSSEFKRNGWNRDTLGNEEDKENKYWEETSSEEYTDMVDSVNINKGFYISRYEASKKDSTTAQSKRGQYPWGNVMQTTAITASKNMKTSINSHLIYGVEWDSVLQWLLDSNATIGAQTGGTKTITVDDIEDDSSRWGNYYSSLGGAATSSGSSAKPGGTNEYWKVNNIYDLAGNAWEWTQEKYDTSTDRAHRGGGFGTGGHYNPAASRISDDESYTNGLSNIRVQSRLLCVVLYSGSEN